LITQTEQIIPDLRDEPLIRRPSRPPKDRFRTSDYSYGVPKFSKPNSELVKKCFRVLSQVQRHEFSQPFLKPVDPIALNIPDYPLIVKEPMDLSKVEKKLKTGMYSNPMQFALDMRKIWSNAILYNPKNSAIYQMTTVIRDFFENIYKPVEENPFPDQGSDYLPNIVSKLEKKLDEAKNRTPSTTTTDEYVDPLEVVMTREEKRLLMQNIQNLKPEFMSGITEIIIQANPYLQDRESIDIDLNKQSTRVLRKIERYIKNKTLLAKRFQKETVKRTDAKIESAKKQYNEDGTLASEQPALKRKYTEDEDDHDKLQRDSESSFFTHFDSEDEKLQNAGNNTGATA